MRLTLVTETFPPEVNGVARTLGRWVDTFRLRGHQVQVIHPQRPGEARAPERVSAWPLPFYPEVRIGLAFPGRLARLLRRHGSDLVHVATEGPLGWAALWAARRQGIPIVSSYHTNFDQYLEHYRLGFLRGGARAFLRAFHNRTRLTLVPSAATRRQLGALGFERVEIWSRGVDSERFHPRYRDETLRRRLGLQEGDPLILYVGRIAPEKNLPALVSAFTALQQRLGPGARLRLALVGHGPMWGELRARQLDGVVLPGLQQGEELSRWYASADLFAFPSLTDTFGNVILEAMASGLPVVAFNSGGSDERITHDVEGVLAPANSCLSAALEPLCRDRARRRQLGLAARQRAERQSWDAIFDQLEQRYLDAIAERRNGRPE